VTDSDTDAAPTFRLAYVPGVTPGKWVRIWNERLPGVPLVLDATAAAEAPGALREDRADAALLRMPQDPEGLNVIPLYTETTVVVVPKDHVVVAADEVTVADLADDVVFHPLDDTLEWERLPGRPAVERPATTEDAIELVAAGVGVLVLPQSLARLYHRKDLTYRPVTDAPASRVGLAWRADGEPGELVEEFIGIVRGRTVNSSRGRQQAEPAPKVKARAKAKARAERRAAASPSSSSSSSGGKGGARRGRPRRRS
jgi:DNA-binding transcriptional LysR family regulator